MMTSTTDPAEISLNSFIHGPQDEDPAPALISRAVTHWAASEDPYGWSGMYLPQQYRDALVRAGLADSDLQTITSGWAKTARARFEAREANPAEQIWGARLLLLMGCYQLAWEQLLQVDRDDAEAAEWAAHLERLVAASRTHDARLMEEAPLPLASSRLLRLNQSLFRLIAAITRTNADAVTASHAAAQEIANEIRTTSAPLGAAADARILRVMVPWARVSGGAAQLSELIDEQIERLTGMRPSADAAISFIVDEAISRVLDAASVGCLRSREYEAAKNWSARAVLLDPYSARVRLLHAMALERCGERSEAIGEYRLAARYGVVERSFSRMALSRLSSSEAAVGYDDDLASWGDENDTKNRWLYLSDGTRTKALSRIPIDAAALEDLGQQRAPVPSDFERRLFPYLTMDQATTVTPLFAEAPKRAWDVFLQEEEPWFSSLYMQRQMVPSFRAELAHAAVRAGVLGGAAQGAFDSWLTLSGSAAKQQLADALAAGSQEPLVLVRLARVLSFLGFFDKAQAILNEVPDLKGPEYSYARALKITFNYLTRSPGTPQDQSAIEKVYGELSDDPRYARIRLSLCISEIVASARLRQLPLLDKWHARGLEALKRYTSLREVDDFEKELMTSRFYRAAGFKPFLNHQHEALRADCDRWLGIARDLTGYDERTRILARDNMYPALESAARTEAALGNKALSRDRMEEITTEVDPLDSKGWIQVAEMRQKDNDLKGTLTAYLNAAHCQVPFGRIAWFCAGRCWEKLGDSQEAFECYRRSLEYWPTGLSPVQRIEVISQGQPLETAYAASLSASFKTGQ
jgi:tetratricopeptide (TPR) repeat protein